MASGFPAAPTGLGPAGVAPDSLAATGWTLSPSDTVCPTPSATASSPVNPAVTWTSMPLSIPSVTGCRWIVRSAVTTGTNAFSLRSTSASSGTIG